MPQLNPAPWFLLLVFTWLVFTTIAPSKIMAYSSQNNPSILLSKKSSQKPWSWPWH